jgi:hypothetical protein
MHGSFFAVYVNFFLCADFRPVAANVTTRYASLACAGPVISISASSFGNDFQYFNSSNLLD